MNQFVVVVKEQEKFRYVIDVEVRFSDMKAVFLFVAGA